MGVVEGPLYSQSQIDTLPFTSLSLPVSLFSRIVWGVLRGEFTLSMKDVRSEREVTREVGGGPLDVPPAGRPIHSSIVQVPRSVFPPLETATGERAQGRSGESAAGAPQGLPIFLQSDCMVRPVPGVFTIEPEDAHVVLRWRAAAAGQDGKNSRDGRKGIAG